MTSQTFSEYANQASLELRTQVYLRPPKVCLHISRDYDNADFAMDRNYQIHEPNLIETWI